MLPAAVGIGFAALVLGSVALKWRFADRPGSSRRATQRLRELEREFGVTPIERDLREGEAQNTAPRSLLSTLFAWISPATGQQAARLRSQLALAGYKNPNAVKHFVGFQLLSIFGFAAASGVVAAAWPLAWPKILLFTGCGAAAGLMASSLALSSRVARRNREINRAFPDALDILVLSVEGGASLNAAINWVTDEIQSIHPVLGAELAIAEGEIQLGLSPAEALKSLAERCNSAEIRELSSAILQSEKYGGGVAKAMRSFADAARQDRQLRAEEFAQKAAVKIVFPMLLFIFPAIFIVLLGPAAMQMQKLFAK